LPPRATVVGTSPWCVRVARSYSARWSASSSAFDAASEPCSALSEGAARSSSATAAWKKGRCDCTVAASSVACSVRYDSVVLSSSCFSSSRRISATRRSDSASSSAARSRSPSSLTESVHARLCAARYLLCAPSYSRRFSATVLLSALPALQPSGPLRAIPAYRASCSEESSRSAAHTAPASPTPLLNEPALSVSESARCDLASPAPLSLIRWWLLPTAWKAALVSPLSLSRRSSV